MRQIANALRMYADVEGALPPAAQWQTAIRAYMPNHKLFQNPKNGKKGITTFGYGFNRELSGAKLKDISDPEQTPMVVEVFGGGANALADPLHPVVDRDGPVLVVFVADKSSELSEAEFRLLNWKSPKPRSTHSPE